LVQREAENMNARAGGAAYTRRGFLAASGAAVVMGASSLARAQGEEARATNADAEAIHFPRSFLHCSPTDSGIRVRVQMECRGRLVDAATGEADEYVLGVLAKTGLTPDPHTDGRSPGYDYVIIFSRSHVFTKRSHVSAYFNNPTVLNHEEFGSAQWRLRSVPAQALTTPADVQIALENWREMTASTTFTSADGARKFTIEYPVKWADCLHDGSGFRVETGPVFLLDPDKFQVGQVPKLEDFRWAHLDYRSFDRVRLLMEKQTSILEGATFSPPEEHHRQFRENPALTKVQLEQINGLLFAGDNIPLSPERMRGLLSTDHYSAIEETQVTTELYALVTGSF
jgi:hypothetical protein